MAFNFVSSSYPSLEAVKEIVLVTARTRRSEFGQPIIGFDLLKSGGRFFSHFDYFRRLLKPTIITGKSRKDALGLEENPFREIYDFVYLIKAVQLWARS